MSAEPVRLESVNAARSVLSQWTQGLVQVLESMTDQKPSADWQFQDDGPAAGDAEVLWWQQPFPTVSGGTVWIGAPHDVWETCGALTLKAAGLEIVDPAEARNTWFEILGQSLGVMARSITALCGAEVTCGAGSEAAPAAGVAGYVAISLSFPGQALPPMVAAFSPGLIEFLATPPPEAAKELMRPAAEGRGDAQPSRTMELLLDVDLPITISFGKAQLPVKDVLKLTTGSIVELNRGVNEPVEVLVNHCLIARGEVVVVEGNYGVRIQEIASRYDRLRSIR